MSANANMARFAELIREEGMYSLSGPMPAMVVSYDRVRRSATLRFPVRLPVRDLDTGEYGYEDVGEVEDVPVFHLAGGGFSQTFDLQAGDTGLVVVFERPAGEWLVSGASDVSPRLDERFTLNGCVFLPGLSAFTRSLPAEAGKWLWDGALFQFGASATSFVALADDVAARISALEEKFNAHTHTVPLSIASVPFVGATTTATPPLGAQIDPITTAADLASTILKAE